MHPRNGMQKLVAKRYEKEKPLNDKMRKRRKLFSLKIIRFSMIQEIRNNDMAAIRPILRILKKENNQL